MNFNALPWTDLCVILPCVGAGLVGLVRSIETAWRWTTVILMLVLVASMVSWVSFRQGTQTYLVFSVDELTSLLLPLVALLHFLLVFATARVKLNRMSLSGHLFSESLRLGMFATSPEQPWLLIALLILSMVPPWIEIVRRGNSPRIFLAHMIPFAILLILGWLLVCSGASALGSFLLLLAMLLRIGTFPVHLWISDLFNQASFGTAILFVTPLSGVFMTLRLVMPIAPDWMLESTGLLSLLTGLYAAGMATVQNDVRRFFAYLFLSHGSLVLVGLELHTRVSLTGALCLWVSISLSLGGLGLILRAIESRFGKLTLENYQGLYQQSPALAIGFLITGLSSVGFPGTLGFIAAELLIDGAINANIFVGISLVLISTINGIAVLRAYFLLFTGAKSFTSVPLGISFREQLAVLALIVLLLGGGLYPQLGISDRQSSVASITRLRASTR